MRKIIDGKAYNTETAEEMGYWWNGLGTNDFSHCTERLYRTKKGSYFIYGEGGPSSVYRERAGDMWASGNDIRPLTVTEAREWAEKHLNADEYEAIFGEVEEA